MNFGGYCFPPILWSKASRSLYFVSQNKQQNTVTSLMEINITFKQWQCYSRTSDYSSLASMQNNNFQNYFNQGLSVVWMHKYFQQLQGGLYLRPSIYHLLIIFLCKQKDTSVFDVMCYTIFLFSWTIYCTQNIFCDNQINSHMRSKRSQSQHTSFHIQTWKTWFVWCIWSTFNVYARDLAFPVPDIPLFLLILLFSHLAIFHRSK